MWKRETVKDTLIAVKKSTKSFRIDGREKSKKE